MTDGYVYAVQSGEAVKIGWAKNPARRIGELAVGSPAPLTLLGFTAGTRHFEKSLHKKFKDYHLRGEWFFKEGSVLEFVNSLPPYVAKAKARSKRARSVSLTHTSEYKMRPNASFDFLAFLRKFWGDPDRLTVFLRSYGHEVPFATVNQWFRRQMVPSQHFPLLIIFLQVDQGNPISLEEFLVR